MHVVFSSKKIQSDFQNPVESVEESQHAIQVDPSTQAGPLNSQLVLDLQSENKSQPMIILQVEINSQPSQSKFGLQTEV